MKPVFLSITAAFALFLQFNACAQSANQSTGTAVKKIQQVENHIFSVIRTESDTPMNIRQRMAFYKVKGLSIAVVRNYKIEWAKGYGWADDSLKVPVTVHTLFQAASISKSLNGVGVLKLVQDKKLDLYADINNYLRTWKFPYDSLSKNKKISMANLLSHTAGLTVHGFEGYAKGAALPTIPEILDGKKPANSPPVRSMFEPGLRSEYSGGGITISQLIVMDVTHQTYEKYMKDNVLRPFGMIESTYSQPPLNIKPELLATAYRPNGTRVKGDYHIYPEQAAAGLWTNPTDLSRYIIETQLAYAGKSRKVLDQQTTKLRLTPYIDKNAALGVFIDDFGDVKYFEHGGANEGFRCQYYGSLDGGNGVVIMVNSDNGAIMNEIVSSIARVYDFKGLDRSKIRTTVVVADSVLESYTGKYEITTNFILTITREGNHLYGQARGQGKVELFPETQSKFFLKAVDAQLEFIKDNKGQITKAVLYQDGVHDAKKLK